MKKRVIKKGIILGIILLCIETSVTSANYYNQSNSSKTINFFLIWNVGGSGPGNLSTISAAYDNASDGDIIRVWNYSAPYHEEFLTIEKSLQIVRAENNIYPVIELIGSLYIKHNQVLIQGFTIQLQLSNSSVTVKNCNDVIIENNNIAGGGIDLEFAYNCILSNNTFDHYGLYFYGSDLTHYNSHTIENNYVNGRLIRFYKDSNAIIIPNDTSQVILANCFDISIENFDINDVAQGIIIAFSDGITISKNSFSNCLYEGIYIFKSNNILIMKNNIFNRFKGIYAELSNTITIINNDISFHTFDGIDIESCNTITITNNNISFNGENGIMIMSSLDIIIENNQIFNTSGSWAGGYGIVIAAVLQPPGAYSTIKNNNIYNNDYGLGVSHSQYIEITNNKIHDNTYTGLFIWANTLGVCANNQINYNEISNNRDGIVLFNSYLNSFSNNLIKDNSNRSILIVNSRWDTFKHNCIYGYPPLIDSVGSWTIARLNFWGRPMILPWLYMRLVLSWVQCFPPLIQPPPNVGPQS